MAVIIRGKGRCFFRHHGFSLVELMIALLIGLFLIGGVVGFFISNQQTSEVKRNLDNAQESFRFASMAISRVVRLGGGVDSSDSAILEPSSDNELIVRFPEGEGVKDCLGQPAETEGDIAENRFFVNGGALLCDNSSQTGTLVSGIESMEVRYGVPGASQWVADSDYMLAADITADTSINWADVTSVRVKLKMEGSGRETIFVATARGKVVVNREAPAEGSEEGGAGLDEENEQPGGSEEEGAPTDDSQNGDDDTVGDDVGESSDDSVQDGAESGSDESSNELINRAECACKQRGNSGNFTLVGDESTYCTDECCNQSPDQCTGNNCTFVAVCPVPVN